MSLQSLITRCLGKRDAVAVAREQAARWQPWLQPISEASPVGDDPGYDDDFQRMREEVDKLSGADAERVAQLAGEAADPDLQGSARGHLLRVGALAPGR